MGLKGKLVVSMEVKCGGHLFHDLCQTTPHNLLNISPNRITGFDLHEGEMGEAGSIVTWKYKDDKSPREQGEKILEVRMPDFHLETASLSQVRDGNEKTAKCVIEAIDDEEKSSTWKLIGGDLLETEGYNAFIVNLSCDHQWITWTLEYEKKTENTSEPITFLGHFIELNKDIEAHHVEK